MKYLYDIAIMRPIIILLVVIYHAFAVYSGIWAEPDGLLEIPSYHWICKFSQGFHIEGMTFIAGYVFAYQCLSMHKQLSFGSFILKKAKRLFIPTILFGLLYYFLFEFDANSFNIVIFIIQLLSGVAHLWFLPMLFWCFIGLWIIDHYKLSSWWLLLILAIISIIPDEAGPLGLTRVPHFLFYAYAGYRLYEKRDDITSLLTNRYIMISLWLLYIILCSIENMYILPLRRDLYSLYEAPFMIVAVSGIIKLGIASSGIMALYGATEISLPKISEDTKKRWTTASNVSFGVYIIHQFILIGLYYESALLEYVGSYWLPWIGLTITLPISILFTYLAVKTKPGQILLN